MENEIRFPFLGIVFKHVGEGISIEDRRSNITV